MIEKELPPHNTLIEILDTSPWAIHLYYLLWKNQEDNRLIIFIEDVEDVFYISPTLLKEYLFDLAELSILTFQLKNDKIVVELLPQDIVAEGKTLC